MEEPICAGLSHVVIKYKCLCHFFFKCTHQMYAGALIKCYFILEWAWGQGGGGQKNGLTKVSLHKPILQRSEILPSLFLMHLTIK